MLSNLLERLAFLCLIVLIIGVGYLGYNYQSTKQVLDKKFIEYEVIDRNGKVLTVETNNHIYEVTIENHNKVEITAKMKCNEICN